MLGGWAGPTHQHSNILTSQLLQTTSIPMDRAVPSTVLIAASSDAAFRSGSFVLAISSTCFFVTLPTLFLFGTPDPFCNPAALRRRIAAGGVFVTNVNERSEKTVITTGMINPCWPCVRALNVLQNSMMLTPCWPRAGPTGGAGVAWPAGIWSLIYPVTFLAMISS